LKAVADAENQPAAACELFDGAHHRTEARDCAGPQIIAVRKTTGQNHRIAVREVGLLVPDEVYGLTDYLADYVIGVVIAVGARKNNHAEFHRSTNPFVRSGLGIPLGGRKAHYLTRQYPNPALHDNLRSPGSPERRGPSARP